MRKNGVIIFSGYNQRAVIAFCRRAYLYNISIAIVAKSNNDPILKSDYAKNVIFTRENPNLTISLFAEISQIVDFKQKIILPSTEALNRYVIKNECELKKYNYQVPLVNETLYTQISDKSLFVNVCKLNNINVPEEYPYEEILYKKCVAKPKLYNSNNSSNLRQYLLSHKNQWDNFLDDENPNDFFFQEYINGKSFYLLYYISRTNQDVIFSQENLLQQGNGGSIILAKSSNIHNNQIAINYLSLFKKLKFFGLVMVEVKQFNNQFYMIEANPRLWGPSQLFLDSGVPIFEQFLIECGFQLDFQEKPFKSSYYFWSGGLVQNSKQNLNLAYHSFSPKDFIENYPSFIGSEIYNRIDTTQIFINENK